MCCTSIHAQPDPFKLKSGGLVDLKNVKNSDMDG